MQVFGFGGRFVLDWFQDAGLRLSGVGPICEDMNWVMTALVT
jgi:hypothetical protein